MKKRSNLNQRTLTVDEIRQKIREIAEREKKSLPREKPFEDTIKIFFSDLERSETTFYFLAKKIGKKLSKLWPFGFFRKIKKLIPQRLKYKKHLKVNESLNRP